MLTTAYIKRIVELKSGVPDIGINGRERNMSDLRHVYFALCWKYRKTAKPPITLKDSSSTVNRVNHATAFNGKDRFEKLKHQKDYKYNLKIYRACVKEINLNLKHNLTSGDRYLKVLKTEEQHRIRNFELTRKRQELVAKLVHKINVLKAANKLIKKTIMKDKRNLDMIVSRSFHNYIRELIKKHEL